MACSGCSCIIHSILYIFVGVIIFKIYKFYKKITSIPPKPNLPDKWWGSRLRNAEDTSIQPFTINIADNVLDDLKKRLESARPLTSALEGVHHNYGINSKLVANIADFWLKSYSWRDREKFLNQYPQFTVSVQGLRLHYIHVKPTNTENHKVVPILLLHGWPGSIREFYELIPLLTTPREDSKVIFEVIVPSLPGYGFSEGASRPGLGAIEMAVVFKNFMTQLGFEKYYLQGGDWGAIIVQHMATLFPEKVLGVHSNMCFVNSFKSNLKLMVYSVCPSWFMESRFVSKLFPLKCKFANRLLETGYMHLQATKPDTVGVALNDSPIGLMAYILEKFITWTNPSWKDIEDGCLDDKFSYTNLLDNVMIYWVTNSITTSMRLYAETFNKNQMKLKVDRIPVTVPSACARFSNEMVYLPRDILEEKYKALVYESDHNGGHFAAFELPEVMADDIYQAVAKMELYHTYRPLAGQD